MKILTDMEFCGCRTFVCWHFKHLITCAPSLTGYNLGPQRPPFLCNKIDSSQILIPVFSPGSSQFQFLLFGQEPYLLLLQCPVSRISGSSVVKVLDHWSEGWVQNPSSAKMPLLGLWARLSTTPLSKWDKPSWFCYAISLSCHLVVKPLRLKQIHSQYQFELILPPNLNQKAKAVNGRCEIKHIG